MALEEKIGELITAMKENTAALKASGGGGGGGDADKPARGRPAGSTNKDKAPTTKYKAEQVKAALLKVKEEKGAPEAKKIISDAGADDLADLLATKKGKWDEVMDAITEALGDDGEGDGDDDDI